MLLRTALHASITQAFMSAVARYQKFAFVSIALIRIHFLPGVLLILSNLATTHSLHAVDITFESMSSPTNGMRGAQLSLSTKLTLLANQNFLLL